MTPPLVLVACLPAQALEAGPLGPADLEAYRAALGASPDPAAPLVGFRDLWDRPAEFAGKAVAVEGRVARAFRQPAVGTFPPLVEAWVVSPAGDPFCLVFPPAEGRSGPNLGAQIRFSGRFLRAIRYHGGDEDRLAPLIVGPDPPSIVPGAPGPTWDGAAWMLGLAACLVVGLVLARRHLARPSPRSRPAGPPPSFVDGGGILDEAG